MKSSGSSAVSPRLSEPPFVTVGERSDGPLGPGLLARGLLGTIIRDLQANLDDATHPIIPSSLSQAGTFL